jgi:hypothetical protein
MGKSSINGPFSMAMLNNQRVHITSCYIILLCNVWICLCATSQFCFELSEPLKKQWASTLPLQHKHNPGN